MARYNEILVGRFNRHFQKLLSMKGEPPAPQLSSEIQPSLLLFSGAEERYTQGWDRFGRIVSANVVGQVSAIRIRNPLNSGIVVVVEKVSANVGTAMAVSLSIGASSIDEASIVAAAQALDGRQRPNSSTVMSFNSAAPASTAGLGSINTTQLPVNGAYEYIFTHDQEIALVPGWLLLWSGGSAATNLNVNLIWRERPLEPSEAF